ncbi:MAG: 30S ribosomal protein S17 [bacterium]|nr:30S ribosomal protein S17 [bacterium]
MIGKVVSTKMKNTVVVEVERTFAHSVYKKRLKRTSRFHVHDELGVKQGDTVRFEATKPISKLKYHRVIEVLSEGQAKEVEKK